MPERDPTWLFAMMAFNCRKTADSLVSRICLWAFSKRVRIVVPERGAPIRNSGPA